MPLGHRVGDGDDLAAPRREVAIGPLVPDDHRARPVVAAGYRPLEVPVVERVVLDLDRQSLHARVITRALRHGPGNKYAVRLQPKVVVQTARRVLLDDPSVAIPVVVRSGPLARAHRFGGGRKVSLAPVVVQRRLRQRRGSPGPVAYAELGSMRPV